MTVDCFDWIEIRSSVWQLKFAMLFWEHNFKPWQQIIICWDQHILCVTSQNCHTELTDSESIISNSDHRVTLNWLILRALFQTLITDYFCWDQQTYKAWQLKFVALNSLTDVDSIISNSDCKTPEICCVKFFDRFWQYHFKLWQQVIFAKIKRSHSTNYRIPSG